jgi:hypothetical protein
MTPGVIDISLVGANLDAESIKKAFEWALLTDAEMASFPDGWLSMEDPFFGGAAHLFDLAIMEDDGMEEDGMEEAIMEEDDGMEDIEME